MNVKSDYKYPFINDYCGVISNLIEENPVPGNIGMISSLAKSNTLVNISLSVMFPSRFTGLGYDFTSRNLSNLRAIGECLERYCSVIYDKEEIYEGNSSELPFESIDITEITRYPDRLYTEDFPFKKIYKDITLKWVLGSNLYSKQLCFIPVDLIYLNAIQLIDKPIREITSTGLACQTTQLKAYESGLLECIERDAIVKMWVEDSCFHEIDLDTLESMDMKLIRKEIDKTGLELRVIDISTDLRVPTYFSIITSSKVPYCSVGAKTAFDKTDALLGSIREACAVYNLNNLKDYSQIGATKPSQIHTDYVNMHDHSDVFAKFNLNYLLEKKIGIKVNFHDSHFNITTFDQLLLELNQKNIDVYGVDLTTPDVKEMGYHVVRVVVPKLCFLEASFPMTETSRLEDIEVEEIHPHPFP